MQQKPESVTVTRKKCTKCQINKPWDAFALNSRTSSGLQAWCRACQSAYEKSQRASKTTDVQVVKQKPAGPPSVPADAIAMLFGVQRDVAPSTSLVEAKLRLAERILEIQSEVLLKLVE